MTPPLSIGRTRPTQPQPEQRQPEDSMKGRKDFSRPRSTLSESCVQTLSWVRTYETTRASASASATTLSVERICLKQTNKQTHAHVTRTHACAHGKRMDARTRTRTCMYMHSIHTHTRAHTFMQRGESERERKLKPLPPPTLSPTCTLHLITATMDKGFYSQGIDQPDVHSHSNPVNSDLIWLWSQVDFLCPSIYPSANATRDAASIEAMIAGAIESSNLVNPPAKRPAVFPYARAFVAPPGEQPFSKQVLAEQVQLPAGMGVDGIILWGSSSDYHGNGCAMIEQELTAFAGPVVAQCSADRAACARTRCSGNGRCVDYNPATLESTCIGSGSALASSSATCRCNPGFAGNSCENSAVLIN